MLSLFHTYIEIERDIIIQNYKQLQKQREIYVANTFSVFQTLHTLSQSARSRANFSLCYDMRFFEYVKTSLLRFVNMRLVLVFSLLLFTSFLLIIDAEYWIPMYKTDTPCKLEKRSRYYFTHFRTQDSHRSYVCNLGYCQTNARTKTNFGLERCL